MKKSAFYSSSFLIALGVFSACKAEEIAQGVFTPWLAHKPIVKPQPLSKKNDLLFIGLEPYLGRGNYEIESPIKLRLRSDSKILINLIL